MIDISEVQKIILDNNPAEYYKEYMRHEINYWKPMLDWMPEENNIKNILDVGVGYGTLLIFSGLNHNANLFAIDNKKYMSDKLIKDFNINYNLINIEIEKPYYDIKFDYIILSEVLEHLNFNPIVTLTKLKNMLNKNGILFLSTPDAKAYGKLDYYDNWRDIPNYDSKIEIKDAHIYQYNFDEVCELFDEAGFKIEKYVSVGFGDYLNMNFKLSKK